MDKANLKDHRQIGQEQDLFVVSDLVGGGLPLFTPKGTIIRKVIHDFIDKLQSKLGYQEVWIPHMAKPELYKKSGHFEKYPERFSVTSAAKDEFILKPMNCPHHMEIFKARTRSYKDLPIAYSEFTTNYRDEQTGELNGLLRVRSLTMDDCHIFCTEDQIVEEAKKVYQTIVDFYKAFNFEMKVRLSLRDPKNKNKYIGDDETWVKSENMIKEIAKNIKFQHYEGIGEAAFYGPKIDFMIKDTLGREWQLATIQLDYIIPGRLGLEYVDAKGEKRVPVAIHRAIAGSIERFTGILLEQYQGALPLWLSPVQVIIMPITDNQEAHAKKIVEELKEKGIRTELDNRPERLQAKIRDASLQKVPYLGIIGDKEIKESNISVRMRNGKDLGKLKVSDFLQKLKEEIDKKI
jgi:threonyl-tRNA synthetase